jgi:hypothetical protein
VKYSEQERTEKNRQVLQSIDGLVQHSTDLADAIAYISGGDWNPVSDNGTLLQEGLSEVMHSIYSDWNAKSDLDDSGTSKLGMPTYNFAKDVTNYVAAARVRLLKTYAELDSQTDTTIEQKRTIETAKKTYAALEDLKTDLEETLRKERESRATEVDEYTRLAEERESEYTSSTTNLKRDHAEAITELEEGLKDQGLEYAQELVRVAAVAAERDREYKNIINEAEAEHQQNLEEIGTVYQSSLDSLNETLQETKDSAATADREARESAQQREREYQSSLAEKDRVHRERLDEVDKEYENDLKIVEESYQSRLKEQAAEYKRSRSEDRLRYQGEKDLLREEHRVELESRDQRILEVTESAKASQDIYDNDCQVWDREKNQYVSDKRDLTNENGRLKNQNSGLTTRVEELERELKNYHAQDEDYKKRNRDVEEIAKRLQKRGL